MPDASQEGLRRRRYQALDSPDEYNAESEPKDWKASTEEVVWGKTPSGEVFSVPTTHGVLTLFHPSYPKSHLDIMSLALLGLQIVLFFVLPRSISRPLFLVYFAFWRLAYDVGLGWVLTKQSKKKWIVREMHRLGWLDQSRKPQVRNWIRKQLAGKMGKDYFFDNLPLEYNTWLLFRQLVDIILLNDFVSYCLFAFLCFRVPEGLSAPVHFLRWFCGIILIAFNLWVKSEAHHVVKDYGWYWGDVFFQRGALVFDGVFELAPHPMYSVGYAGYYGLSLIAGSYAVLFVSIVAHAAQFGFLVFFENPHIERTYKQKKLLATRVPLTYAAEAVRQLTVDAAEVTTPRADHHRKLSMTSDTTDLSTPAFSEGETATETEGPETETEVEVPVIPIVRPKPMVESASHAPSTITSRLRHNKDKRPLSQHDLLNTYFRSDLIIFQNFDLLRAPDFMVGITIAYAAMLIFIPPLSENGSIILHFAHALLWRIYYTFVLGMLLKAQSESKFLVRHFLKHYHYSNQDLKRGRGVVQETFANWKVLYNLAMCMTYFSFAGLAWRAYRLPHEWFTGDQLLRHTLGIALILLHVWAARESYEVLGVFGWFFGDFFIEDYPTTVEYTGIFRYLNNPEILSGATFFGLALITGNKLVFVLAIFSILSYWWFLRTVENPHMEKRYGDSLRKDAGFTKIIKKVALRNARFLESRAGRHAPELRRVAQEVKGSFDKAFEETAEVVEELLNKSRPRISEVVQDTKELLQHSRERLLIPLVANDLPVNNILQYSISIDKDESLSSNQHHFHLGEPIAIKFRVPSTHSHKDWIGIYRLGANSSTLVTTTSALGHWVPVHDDEWDGDVHIGHENEVLGGSNGVETGIVVFRGDTLPWQIGTYEVRYHHGGKHNVLARISPIKISVSPPASDNFDDVRSYLLRVVTFCLNEDPSLVPLSARIGEAQYSAQSYGPSLPSISSSPSPLPPLTTSAITVTNSTSSSSESVIEYDHTPTSDAKQQGQQPAPWMIPSRDPDPDDFRFWSESQAERIAKVIEAAFGVEYDSQVIFADANVSALANRILVSKQLLNSK